MGEERETPPGETAQGQGTGDGGSLPQSRLRRASSLVRGSQEMGEERETPPGGTAEGQEAQEPVAPAAAQVRAHFDALTAQAAELQKTFPGFSLAEELKNPVFLRMTAPGISIPLADAYYAVHHKELQTAAMQVTAQVTAQKLAASVQAGTLRPDESGGAQAPSVTAFNYASASRQQREALKQRIRAAAAQGKRIFP
nr:MAG TPA: hypothetical protein [Caudoviricetes sp.]